MIINPNLNEITRYMGTNIEDSKSIEDIKIAIDVLNNNIIPMHIYKIIDISEFKFVGNDIKNHLLDCSYVYLLCATLGSKADMLIREAEYRRVSLSLAYDAAATWYIEHVCDNVEEEIRNIESRNKRHITSRYSPGYGDYDIFESKYIISQCNAKKEIGLTFSQSGIMIPRKSVTAIIGVSKQEKMQVSKIKCDLCKSKNNCLYRKRGTQCDNNGLYKK